MIFPELKAKTANCSLPSCPGNYCNQYFSYAEVRVWAKALADYCEWANNTSYRPAEMSKRWETIKEELLRVSEL